MAENPRFNSLPDLLNAPTEQLSSIILEQYPGKPQEFYNAFGVERFSRELPNGIKVVFLRKPGVTSVHCHTVIARGSLFDPQEYLGLAHMDEHMFLSGTNKTPNLGELVQPVEYSGGYLNAETGYDTIELFTKLNRKVNAQKGIDVMASCLGDTQYSRTKINTERQMIKNEIRESQDKPEESLSELLYQTLYQGTLLARPIGGTIGTVNKITREQLLYHAKESRQGKRIAIVGGGDMPFEEFFTLIADSFKEVPPGERTPVPHIIPLRESNHIGIKREKNTNMVYYSLGYNTVSETHPDRVALGLIASLLGDGFSSLLDKSLRQNKGRSYSCDVDYSYMRDVGHLAVNVATSSSDLQKTIDIVSSLYETLREKGISEQELALRKNLLIEQTIGATENIGDWVDEHSRVEGLRLYQDTDRSIPELDYSVHSYMLKVASLTTEDIKRVAETYFTDQWSMALYGDVKGKNVTVPLGR